VLTVFPLHHFHYNFSNSQNDFGQAECALRGDDGGLRRRGSSGVCISRGSVLVSEYVQETLAEKRTIGIAVNLPCGEAIF
jgi:hypothetical protein